MKAIEVYDVPSGMGGKFTVSILNEIDDNIVECRVWYGRPTRLGWESWTDWDGYTFTTDRAKLSNKRMMALTKR